MTEQANRRNGQRRARAHTSLPAESPQVWRGGGGASGRLWLTPCVIAALTTTLGWWGASPSLSFYKIPGSWTLNTERPFARGPGGSTHCALSSQRLSSGTGQRKPQTARLPPPRGKPQAGLPGGLRPQRAGHPQGPRPLQEPPVSILAPLQPRNRHTRCWSRYEPYHLTTQALS